VPRRPSQPPSIQPVRALSELNPDRIRDQWHATTGARPPVYASPRLLMLMLAERIQSAQYGGMKQALRRRLEKLSTEFTKGGAGKLTNKLSPGTVLMRDWQGRRHSVMVTADGFAHEGRTYRSLSEIARAMGLSHCRAWPR
jgi:Protein of unknown function (DUF2924)